MVWTVSSGKSKTSSGKVYLLSRYLSCHSLAPVLGELVLFLKHLPQRMTLRGLLSTFVK